MGRGGQASYSYGNFGGNVVAMTITLTSPGILPAALNSNENASFFFLSFVRSVFLSLCFFSFFFF